MPKLTNAEKSKRWRERHPERAKEVKIRYYASDKGKAQKRKEDAAYVASGGRAMTEMRRASRPLSAARKDAKLRYQLMRRANEKTLDELSELVLREAVNLLKLRSMSCGGDWHVDHVIPISKGGSSHYTNLQVVPGSWNRAKSNKHFGRFMPSA